jgi:hypothetical protein
MNTLVTELERFIHAHSSVTKLLAEFHAPHAKSERLELIVELLSEVPCPTSMAEAKLTADTVLNIVENLFSGVPYDPGKWRADGRMYPAQEDARRRTSTERVAGYFHVGHESYFADNGAFRIQERHSGKVLIDRPGPDGRNVGDILEEAAAKLHRDSS